MVQSLYALAAVEPPSPFPLTATVVRLARRAAAAVAWVIDLCRRALIGTQLPGLVWTPVLAAVIAGIFVSGLLLPRAANAGVLVVLPVLAAAWMLRCRYVAVVVCLALASQLGSAAAGVANPVLAGAGVVTIVAVAGVSRLGALSWGELRQARQHEVGALLEASHNFGRSLDLASVGAEAVRAAAGTVVRPGLAGGRRAVLLRVVEGRVVVVAACDGIGTTLGPAADLPLIEMPLSLHETLRSGRTTVASAAEAPRGLCELVVGADAGAWAMARVEVANAPFGVLTVAGSHPAEFKRDDLRLLDGIARVAGLAVATAVRHAELAELERRLQDSVDLALEVGRSLEPSEVAASILVRMAESVRADRATLASLDGGALVVEATYWPAGGGRPVPVARQFGPDSVEAIPLLAHALAAGQPMTCGRLGAAMSDRGLAAALADGRHTLIFPFVMAGHTASVLVLGRREEPFDETDLARLGPMADVALIALRNAHLYAEAERAKLAASTYSDRLQLAIEAAEDIGSSQQLSEVLERVLRRAVTVVRAERGSVSRLEDGVMVVEHDHDPSGHQVSPGVRWELRHSPVAAEAMRTRRPIYGRLSRTAETPEMAAWAEATSARHVIHCPLVVGREVVGLLGLSRRGEEGFDETDLLALRPFATLAGLLLRNARLLAEARRVGQAKSAFLNLAAHELRTPLAVIKGYLSLLDDGTYPVPERTREEAIQTLIAKAQELETLVEALLTTARLEVGLPRAPVDFDVCDEVRQAAGRAGPRARLERAAIELQLPGRAVLTRADRGHVGRILDNLLNNALTYSERPASVTVSVRGGDQVEVAVADRGLGIPPEQHHRVFERFHRLERGGSRFTPGLGLGLSISRELAQTNDGALVLEASTPGEGSVFVLRLPAAAGAAVAVAPGAWRGTGAS